MKKISTKDVFCLSFVIALIGTLGFARHVLKLEQNYRGVLLSVKQNNLRFYFLLLVLFFTLFFGVRIIFGVLGFGEGKRGGVLLKKCSLRMQIILIGFSTMVTLALSLHWYCVDQWNEYGRPDPVTIPIFQIPILIIGTILIAGIIISVSMIIKQNDISSVSLFCIYVMCIILVFFSLYHINIFRSNYYHGIAVLESIYNSGDLIPFSKFTTGIYGHYSIFFVLPMYLSKGSLQVAVGLLAASGCIAYIFTFYVINYFMPKKWLKAIAACASVFVISVLQWENYWQLYPLRIVFPMIFCAFFVFLTKKRKLICQRKWLLIGYFLGSLAVLWNTESGIFCLLAYSVYIIISKLQQHKWYEKKMVVVYVTSTVCSVISTFFSIVIVNIYNLFCGGEIILKDFFFPLFNANYMNTVLRSDMMWGNYPWIYTLILFLSILAWGIYNTSLFKKGNEVMYYDAPSITAIALLGLISFSYYANRAAFFNLGICYLMAICGIAINISKTWSDLNNWDKIANLEVIGRKIIAIMSLIVLISLGVQVPLSLIQLHGWEQSGLSSIEEIETEISTWQERLPKNTFGVGAGISVIYHILGWNTYGHYIDMSDLYIGGEEVINNIVEDVLRHDSFLLGEAVNGEEILNRVLKQDATYKLKDTFTIYNVYNFYYYSK